MTARSLKADGFAIIAPPGPQSERRPNGLRAGERLLRLESDVD